MIRTDGNGGLHLDSWKFFLGVLTLVLTLVVVVGGGIGYVMATKEQVNDVQTDVTQLEEITVPRREYEKDREHIEEKMDYIHEDVKEIKELIKNGKGGE